MKIVVISDTHGLHDYIKEQDLPDADILIHAGDFMNGGIEIHEVRSFNTWLGKIHKFKHKLIVAGNHDIAFDIGHKYSSPEKAQQARNILTNGTYVQDELVIINGIKIYLSPWTPEFYGWGFNVKRDSLLIKAKWDEIPDSTQVLVTHGPPMGILDQTSSTADHVGCERLTTRVKNLPHLKYHVFGHIHGSAGTAPSIFGPTFINASYLNERYKPNCIPFRTIEITNEPT